MSQSPVEWHDYETSPGPSGSHDQNGNYAASISQSMQQLSLTQEQQLHQYIQQTEQQLMQQQPMQHPQIQLQLMQQQPMQHPQMQHHCVDQMMQPTSSVSQTPLQNHQHQTPPLTGLYPANVSRPPNRQTANPPTNHTLQPVSHPSANVHPRCQDPPPTPQPSPGGLFAAMGAKSASGSLSGTVTVQTKRQMNAFMVWAKSERRLMAKRHPDMHNSEILIFLKQNWEAMPIDRKQPFLDEARRMAADMACANGPVTYRSLGGFVGSSYPQIASHNVIFQGYLPQNFGFSGLAPGYMSQSQLQSPIGGGQSRLAHQASQMPHVVMQIGTTSPENHSDATLSPLDGPQ